MVVEACSGASSHRRHGVAGTSFAIRGWRVRFILLCLLLDSVEQVFVLIQHVIFLVLLCVHGHVVTLVERAGNMTLAMHLCAASVRAHIVEEAIEDVFITAHALLILGALSRNHARRLHCHVELASSGRSRRPGVNGCLKLGHGAFMAH